MKAKPVIVVVAVVAALGVAALGARRLGQIHAAEADARPKVGARRVRFVAVEEAKPELDVVLPATARAAQTTMLLPRASGTISGLSVRIGAPVKKGQVLATIDAPDVDAQARLARGRVSEATLALELARRNLARAERLEREGLGTPQATEDAQQRQNSAAAALAAGQAEVARVSALVRYEKIVAPYDGVVSRRTIDNGATVVAGVTPLLELAEDGPLRVELDVPQALASVVKIGAKVTVSPRGPGASVDGSVVRAAGALDPVTRTLRVEVELPKQPDVLAGAYVNARIFATRRDRPLVVPAMALASVGADVRVAALSPAGAVSWKTVTVLRDLGRDVELSGELQKGARVVIYPPADLAEGEVVDAVAR